MHFDVRRNGLTYRPAPRAYRLHFRRATKVLAKNMGLFPSFRCSVYKFRAFSDLQARASTTNTDLFDVIGEVSPVDCTRICGLSQQPPRRNRIKCTLWNNYAAQLFTYLKADYSGAVIIIVQMCRRLFQWYVGLHIYSYLFEDVQCLKSRKMVLTTFHVLKMYCEL